MQASGQYGVPPEVPQYVVGRGPSAHNLFNLSHDVSSLSPSSGHGHPHHGHSSHPQQHHQQQQQPPPHHHQQQHLQQHSLHSQQHHLQSQQAQQEHAHQQSAQTAQESPQQTNMPPHQSQDIQQHQIVQQLGLGPESPKVPSSNIPSGPPPINYNKAMPIVTDPSLVLEDHDGLGDEGERGTPGNRWPRQETLALLKIRSEMDAVFRDSTLKGPLWEEVSRKLAEMGYQRNAKKCKEKFENVHKYYKRTKEGKAGRQDGKSYRFFSQLEALYGNASHPGSTSNSNAATMFAAGVSRSADVLGGATVGSGASNAQGDRSGSLILPKGPIAGPSMTAADTRSIPPHVPVVEESSGLNFSTESSEDESEGDPREITDVPESRKRKRKSAGRMMLFFEGLLKKVLDKQEQLQQKFLEALERREHDRMIREEAWKRQEMARMSREHELRAQERSLAATRDAALVAFLQKVTGQTIQLPSMVIPAQPVQAAPPAVDPPQADQDHSDRDLFDPNSKRWPKPEVLALIKLRSGFHPKFIESGPKGPLWEEISDGMSRLGYSRNAKRCKEKWENINKYYKKAKESNKQRPENAKTCPYFHQLDALYRKGLLGSQAHVKQLPYRVTDRPSDDELLRQQQHQAAAGSSRPDNSAHVQESEVLAIMAPERSPAVEASTSNARNMQVAAATHLISGITAEGSAAGMEKVKTNVTGLADPNSSSNVSAGGLNVDAAAKINDVRQGSSLQVVGHQAELDTIRTDSQLQLQQQQQDHQQRPAMDHQEHDKMRDGCCCSLINPADR